MLIDVNKWIDKNGSFDEAGGLDLVRHGYIIISMKIDFIMRMGMCMLNH